MAISSSFFSANTSGAVVVSGGAVNVPIPIISPFAFEGNQTFVVKLRRGSINGDVLAISSPITIADTSEVVSLTANVTPVSEGNIVSVALVTANVPNYANVYFSVFPVTANVTASDFYGANSGAITIINNQGSMSFYANIDQGYVNEDGETFKVQIRGSNTSGNIVYTSANIVITDFYKLYNAISLIESAATAPEGNAIVFTFTGHNIPIGTALYYDTVGNLTTFSANTGSFIMNGVSNTISITGTNLPSFTSLDYRLRLRQNSVTGPILATSNTIIVVGPTPYVLAYGGTEIVDPTTNTKYHVFTESNTFTVSALSSVSPSRNSITFLTVAGGGGGGGGRSGYWGGMGGAGAGGWIDGTFVANIASSNVLIGAGGVGDVATGPAYNWVQGTKGSNTVLQLPGVGPAGSKISLGGGSASHEFGTDNANGGSGGTGPGYRFYNNPYAGTGFGFPSPTQQGSPGAPGTPGGVYAGGGGGAATAGSSYLGGTGKSFVAPTAYGTPGPAPGRYFAGGGGGGGFEPGPSQAYPLKLGGAGGGGPAGPPASPEGPGLSGNVNTGGGGGGATKTPSAGSYGGGGNGGSGIVIIKYPFVQ